MPWPAGRRERQRAGRGDALADRARPRSTGSSSRTGSKPASGPTRCWPRSGACSRRTARRSSSCPNRSGLWARRDVTPFGFGRPYSFGQLETMLASATASSPERHAAALYAPPSHRRFWLQTAQLWERLGRWFDPRLVAGALLMEATKQIYARPKSGAKAAVPGPLEVLEGLRRPEARTAARAAGARAEAASGPGIVAARRRIATPRSLCYHRAGSPGREWPEASSPAPVRPRGPGDRRRKGGRVELLQSSSFRGGRPLRHRAVRNRQGARRRCRKSSATCGAVEAALAESADLRDMIASPGLQPRGHGRRDQGDRGQDGPRNRRREHARPDGRQPPAVRAARRSSPRSRRSSPPTAARSPPRSTTAKPLTEAQIAALRETLKASVGKNVELAVTVDPSLIGGLVVKVGSRMIDSSIRSKLANLQNVMKEVG